VSEPLPPFQRFLDTYRGEVWRVIRASVPASDADDCFQETFIAALRAYPQLRGRRREHNLRAWVLTIAHRKALDAHRARRRAPVPVAEPQPAGTAAGPSAAGRDEELWQAVESLPERQRSAVVLRFVGDLPHSDIAAAIGCSEEAARRSLHEGLSKLRKVVPA
jgi:RNA polymerase sigma factor (sigma-70 family)